MRHMPPRRGEFGRQRTHGKIGLPGQTRQKPVPGFVGNRSTTRTAGFAGSLPLSWPPPLSTPNGRNASPQLGPFHPPTTPPKFTAEDPLKVVLPWSAPSSGG